MYEGDYPNPIFVTKYKKIKNIKEAQIGIKDQKMIVEIFIVEGKRIEMMRESKKNISMKVQKTQRIRLWKSPHWLHLWYKEGRKKLHNR